jgi:hypothetical protein
LPAVVVATTTTDDDGRARQIIVVRHRLCRPAAALAVPSTSIAQHRHNHCCHRSVFAAAAATNLVLFGRSTFSHTEESVPNK